VVVCENCAGGVWNGSNVRGVNATSLC